MSTGFDRHDVETSHGRIAVEETRGRGLPLLLIHGNSSCREVFRHQLDAPLAERRRVIAFDLPGHGESSDAPDPMRSYTRSGLADAAVELLEHMGIREAAVFGWSLGGHVGIDMLSRFPGMRGLMISGTPPVRRNRMAEGFIGSPGSGLAGKEHLTDAEIEAFAKGMLGEPVEPFLRAAIARTDGRFRKRLFEVARTGEGEDQREAVEGSPVLIGVANGAADPVINLDYIDSVAYAHLWERRCHRVEGVGHAPHWRAPEEFNALLERFLRDVEDGAFG